MSNIYDIFRGVQAKKETCYNERSANFIIEGSLSLQVTHVRLNKTKSASIVFNHKEGPDDVIFYSLIADTFLKGDYFVYNNVYYLIYEDERLTDSTVIYKKQRAVECNVSFNIGQTNFKAFFVSSLRKITDVVMEKSNAVVGDEYPLVIVPNNNLFVISTPITIGSKPWKILEYDNITNAGITYLYLERNYTTTTIAPTPIIPNSRAPIINTLYPMTDYTFETFNAYFASTPKVEVLSRKSTEVIFQVPFGVTTVTIGVKNESDEIVETVYTVVS